MTTRFKTQLKKINSERKYYSHVCPSACK